MAQQSRFCGWKGWGITAGFALLLAVPASAQPTAAPDAGGGAGFHPALDPQRFPVPEALAANVAFWRDVFSKYTSSQTVIHDNWNVDVVFSIVDVSDLQQDGSSPFVIERTRQERVENEIAKYQRVLRRLGGDTDAAASEADLERVRALYAASSRDSDFRTAAGRVRGQGGLKDTFAQAIRRAGLFMPRIERILADHGVPREIRCLPFVESMFNYQARSKVGASGVWQFTAAAARQYLALDPAVDGRHDVWLAAEAAARMLQSDYNRVKSWPLALTGYNHGIAGMERAVRQLGTNDIGIIADQYDSPSFGFASRNFYSEFIAAVTVFADRATLFPGVDPLPEVVFDEFVPKRFVSLLDLASLTDTDTGILGPLNPALNDDVLQGRMLVPAGYPLRVPEGSRRAFERAFEQLPASRKPERQLNRTYRVARGDTLGGIAQRFGTTTAALQRANNLGRANLIRTGQVLQVGGGAAWTPLVWKPAPAAPAPRVASARGADRTHIVRSGETLHEIARRYGLTVAALVAANELISPNRILVGMTLAIPRKR